MDAIFFYSSSITDDIRPSVLEKALLVDLKGAGTEFREDYLRVAHARRLRKLLQLPPFK